MTLHLWVSKLIDEEKKNVWWKIMFQFWIYLFDYRTDTVHKWNFYCTFEVTKKRKSFWKIFFFFCTEDGDVLKNLP